MFSYVLFCVYPVLGALLILWHEFHLLLVCVSPRADSETRIRVQIVYLGVITGCMMLE